MCIRDRKYTPNAPMLATMGDEVLPCRWWAEGALTTFPGLLVNKKGVRYSNENCTYGYMPVSYTHLDVYKRQAQTGEPAA